MRIEVSGVLSSWLTAETKSCCWRASRICPTAKRYINKKPPHSTTASVTATHASSAVPGARGSASTRNVSSMSPNGGDNRARWSTAPVKSPAADRYSLIPAASVSSVRPWNATVSAGNSADAARAVRRFERRRDERRPIDERALHVALAVAPHVAEQDEMPRVEHAELERIDLARERAHGDFDFGSRRRRRLPRRRPQRPQGPARRRALPRRASAALPRRSSRVARATAAPALPHWRRPAPPLRPRAPRLRLLPKRRAPAPRRPVTDAAPARRSKPACADAQRPAPARGWRSSRRRRRRSSSLASGRGRRVLAQTAHELIARQQLAQLRDPRRARRLLGRRDAIACGAHTRLRQQRRREPAGGIDLKIAEHAGHGARDGKLQTAASAARSSRRRRPRPRGTSRRRTSARPRPQWPLATSRRSARRAPPLPPECCETPDT